MRRLLTACVLLLGIIFVYGFIRGEKRDRLTLKIITAPRTITLSITVPDVTERYRWLSVYGCSAAVLEAGTFCTGDYERESSVEIFRSQSQYVIDWRDLPGGTMQVTAMAFDIDDKVVAQNQVTVLRGR